MATINFYTTANMRNDQVFTGQLIGATGSQIIISDGANEVRYGGVFTYSASGDSVFGALQSYREYYNGFLEVTITGLNVDAHVAELYIEQGRVQEIYALGLNGNDTIYGSAFDDYLIGYAGNDQFYPSSGYNTIQGGAGFDTVYINDNINFATWQTPFAGVRTVASSEGTFIAVDIERIQFSDGIVAFDTTGNAGDAYRLYQAAFDRVPDRAGLSYWVNQMDDGMALSQVALNFILSPEFTATYGNINAMSNAQYIEVVYDNVLHRLPDQNGFNYWMNDLGHGYPRHFMLAAFSQSSENQINVAGQISNGIALDLAPFL